MPSESKVRLLSVNPVYSSKDIFTRPPVYECAYGISHNNGNASLTHEFSLKQSLAGWVAVLPECPAAEKETPQEAAEKLADNLERLAKAIRKGQYNQLDFTA
ncbi:hypothetical protein [Neptuniibacter sp. QD37_11]|uniref:hypothetical protein n=1 Tax=Neptuniibacter sp. QD37_11 TaxID=3398209 RepID=UPI0039F59097